MCRTYRVYHETPLLSFVNFIPTPRDTKLQVDEVTVRNSHDNVDA